MSMPLNFALILFELVMLVLAISLHDCAQAWVANRLGDPTGRMLGRITMNPVKHFDPFGMLVWPILFIYSSPLVLGWGKPVPMTYRNFPKKNGEILAVLAGPGAQFCAAVIALIFLVVLKHAVPGGQSAITVASLQAFRVQVQGLGDLPRIFPLLLLLYLCLMVNLLLCVFNLLPMPFLDGGRVLTYFLPYNAARSFEKYSFYFMIAFFFLGFRFIMIAFVPLISVFTALIEKL